MCLSICLLKRSLQDIKACCVIIRKLGRPEHKSIFKAPSISGLCCQSRRHRQIRVIAEACAVGCLAENHLFSGAARHQRGDAVEGALAAFEEGRGDVDEP